MTGGQGRSLRLESGPAEVLHMYINKISSRQIESLRHLINKKQEESSWDFECGSLFLFVPLSMVYTGKGSHIQSQRNTHYCYIPSNPCLQVHHHFSLCTPLSLLPPFRWGECAKEDDHHRGHLVLQSNGTRLPERCKFDHQADMMKVMYFCVHSISNYN